MLACTRSDLVCAVHSNTSALASSSGSHWPHWSGWAFQELGNRAGGQLIHVLSQLLSLIAKQSQLHAECYGGTPHGLLHLPAGVEAGHRPRFAHQQMNGRHRCNALGMGQRFASGVRTETLTFGITSQITPVHGVIRDPAQLFDGFLSAWLRAEAGQSGGKLPKHA